MTRITNVDQVMLLLQSQLQKKGRLGKKRTETSYREERVEAPEAPFARLKSISEDDDLSESEIHRALVRGLLTREFGAGVANDPSFQSIIDDVVKAISRDNEGNRLLQSAVTMLKNTS